MAEEIKFQWTKHILLWQKIVDILEVSDNYTNATQVKQAAFNMLFPNEEVPTCLCFACEYDSLVIKSKNENSFEKDCHYCPLDWPGISNQCDSGSNALFSKFRDAFGRKDKNAAINYAKLIRDCKLKRGIKYE